VDNIVYNEHQNLRFYLMGLVDIQSLHFLLYVLLDMYEMHQYLLSQQILYELDQPKDRSQFLLKEKTCFSLTTIATNGS
jgi:hypothetical protein